MGVGLELHPPPVEPSDEIAALANMGALWEEESVESYALHTLL